METLSLENICKTIGGHVVLDHVNLQLQPGKIYGIIGENGSGKTMLLRLLAGLIHPNEGNMRYGDKTVKKFTDTVRIGLCIENVGLYHDMTVYENMKYYGKMGGKISKKQILDTLDRIELSDRKNTAFSKLSLGLKQKAVLAQAFLSEPELLLLDEPSNGLDEESKELLRNILLEEREKDTCIVIVSHDKTFIQNDVDFLYHMNHGVLTKED